MNVGVLLDPLPREMFNEIFSFTDDISLIMMSSVNKSYQKLIPWKKIMKVRYPGYFRRCLLKKMRLGYVEYDDEFVKLVKGGYYFHPLVPKVERMFYSDVYVWKKTLKLLRKGKITEDSDLVNIPRFTRENYQNLINRLCKVKGVIQMNQSFSFRNNKEANKLVEESGFRKELFASGYNFGDCKARLRYSDGEFIGYFTPRTKKIATFEDYLFYFILSFGRRRMVDEFKQNISEYREWKDIFLMVQDDDFEYERLFPFYDKKIYNCFCMMNCSNNYVDFTWETISGFYYCQS